MFVSFNRMRTGIVIATFNEGKVEAFQVCYYLKKTQCILMKVYKQVYKRKGVYVKFDQLSKF